MKKVINFIIIIISLFLTSSLKADTKCELFLDKLVNNFSLVENSPNQYEYLSGIAVFPNSSELFDNGLYIDSINLDHSLSNVRNHPDGDAYQRFIREEGTEKILRPEDIIYKLNGKNLITFNDEIGDLRNAYFTKGGFNTHQMERMNMPFVDLFELIKLNLLPGFNLDDFEDGIEIGFIPYEKYLSKIEGHDFDTNTDALGSLTWNENDFSYIKIYPEEMINPMDVFIDLDITNISNIDVANKTFDANYFFSVRWYDTNKILDLAKDVFDQKNEIDESEYCTVNENNKNYRILSNMWYPKFDWVNKGDYDENKLSREIFFEFVDWEGESQYKKNVRIEFIEEGIASFETNFNYQSFPFDKQILGIGLVNYSKREGAQGANYVWVSHLDFEELNPYLGRKIDVKKEFTEYENSLSGWKKGAVSYDWHLEKTEDYSEVRKLNLAGEDVEWEDYDYWDNLPDNYSHMVHFTQNIEREWFYYISKILTPIFLILIICWSMLWVSGKELESRLTVTITCFLALVAYTYVIDNDLPQLSYMTLLDYVILVSYIYAGYPTIQSIISHKLFLKNQILYNRMDYFLKYFGPISYIVILYFIMFTNVNDSHTSQFIKTLTLN